MQGSGGGTCQVQVSDPRVARYFLPQPAAVAAFAEFGRKGLVSNLLRRVQELLSSAVHKPAGSPAYAMIRLYLCTLMQSRRGPRSVVRWCVWHRLGAGGGRT